jgi:hypothetical protein
MTFEGLIISAGRRRRERAIVDPSRLHDLAEAFAIAASVNSNCAFVRPERNDLVCGPARKIAGWSNPTPSCESAHSPERARGRALNVMIAESGSIEGTFGLWRVTVCVSVTNRH